MSGKEQFIQITKVLEYIDQHLQDTLPLEKLAKVSTYSPFHFQRIFKSFMGESPAAYIKRLRLENAAHLLIYEREIPITEVALMCGFSSISYFTYSFKENFSTSPKKWREGAYLELFPRVYQDSKKSKLFSNIKKEEQQQNPYNEFRWLDLDKVRTIELPVCATVHRQSVGPYTEGIPDAWEDLYHWTTSRELMKPDPFTFGVPRNNPYITPPEKTRYDCRIAIDQDKIPEGEPAFLFKGGKHVVYEFDEPVDYSERSRLIECYSELYSFWLPRSGYRYLDNPVELVDVKPLKGSLSVECKIRAICLAIEPK
ncbi:MULTISPECIES: helix-turn-helix domain-containing protein [Bacillus]|uniref:AraC family transcriptional regulator n=1 Tax=Bacillus TaxID=1386 RepID=UPI0028818667|nr:helix-turn-helix domain-containing protein [Bacillus sp. AG4(2022)]MDT0162978.1 helix-turn-helix domain-containing protein [Bacillus sp. AG4(2022)]